MFENGRTSVMDAKCLGRPSTSTTDEKLEEARAIILTDRRVTIEERCHSNKCQLLQHVKN